MKDILKNTKAVILSATAFIALLLFGGCKSHEPDVPGNKSLDRVVLVYAVASNNLVNNLWEDKGEMLKALSGMRPENEALLVYEVTKTNAPRLLKAEKGKDGNYVFSEVKVYNSDVYSTDPKRIREVMDDVRIMYESDRYGLVLWSHGTGWDPSFPSHGEISSQASPLCPEEVYVYSFGMDNNEGILPGYNDAIDIDELADAIPSGMFDFIWFDACYMASMETVYEFKGKCNWFAGYPTEVYTPGMPYDLTIPYLLKKDPDLEGASKVFFEYYEKNSNSSLRNATVALIDMNGIEKASEVCSKIFKDYDGSLLNYGYGLQKYSRPLRKNGKTYDFKAYDLKSCAYKLIDINKTLTGDEKLMLKSEFDNAMDDLILYSNHTERDFNYKVIDDDGFSGLSIHLYNPEDNSDEGNYYRTLGWYRAVYQ